MLASAALVLALAAPTQDQWSYLFDHGDRWPGCTVTYDVNKRADTKALRRAVKDIKRVSGVTLVKVPRGTGQIKVTQYRRPSPDNPGYIAQGYSWTPGPESNDYIEGFLWAWKWLPYWSSRYQRSVWQHEFGHALGLGHVDDLNEVMAHSTSKAPINSPGWVGALRVLYPECS